MKTRKTIKTYHEKSIDAINFSILYHKHCLKEAQQCHRSYDINVHSTALKTELDKKRLLIARYRK
jgi:hypothetical protein